MVRLTELAPDLRQERTTKMITLERVKNNISDVTPEQMDKATHIWGQDEEYYLVANSKGEFDEEGNIIEYKVQYSHEHGFVCGCPSGLHGFSNVKHPSGCCWHVRAAVAAFLREEAEVQEMAEAEKAAKENGTLQHPQEVIAVNEPIWEALPDWIKNARPSRGMDKAPRER